MPTYAFPAPGRVAIIQPLRPTPFPQPAPPPSIHSISSTRRALTNALPAQKNICEWRLFSARPSLRSISRREAGRRPPPGETSIDGHLNKKQGVAAVYVRYITIFSLKNKKKDNAQRLRRRMRPKSSSAHLLLAHSDLLTSNRMSMRIAGSLSSP